MTVSPFEAEPFETAPFEVAPIEVASIGVVVPARNEELRLPRCLAALRKAVLALRAADPTAPRVRIVVVVDDSTDGTHGIAAGWAGVEVVVSDTGRVGAARAAGVRHLLKSEALAGGSDENVWIACTDADSAVPADWLNTQLRHARAGVELVLGTVRPDPRELADGVLAAWRLRHLVTDGHPHVHGANMGVRGDTYVAVGGFQEVATHEDLLLNDAVRAAGRPVMSTAASPVLTSGRMHGRAPSGLADYLQQLSVEVDLPA